MALLDHVDTISLSTYQKDGKFLLVYVDDLVLTSNDSAACSTFKAYLNSCFRTKDLGPLKHFLEIEVARNSQGLFLLQWKYALEIVEECGLLWTKPTNFPMDTNHQLGIATGKFFK